MDFPRRLAWVLERGQVLGLDGDGLAGHHFTCSANLRRESLTAAIYERFSLAQIVLITAELN